MAFDQIGGIVKTLANPSSSVTLLGGQGYVLPSGQWLVQPGKYTFLQYYDPVSLAWRNFQGPLNQAVYPIASDGVNYRLFNPTGTVVGGIVTNGGTANTAKNGIWPAGSSSSTGVTATTTVGGGTPAGTATFNVIVGGEINTSVTISNGGSGYVLPPIVQFSPPPAGGLLATGTAAISAGAVSSITVTNQGAGYTSAPTVTLVTAAGDSGSGATATAAVATTNSGKIVAVTMANNGAGYTATPTVTIAGLAGSPAITAIMCYAVSGAATVSGATHMGNGSQLIYVASVQSGSNTTTNPAYTTGIFQPRNGMGAYNTSASMATQTILDGGLSQLDHSAQCVIMTTSDGTISGATTFGSGTVGAVTDQSFIIPL